MDADQAVLLTGDGSFLPTLKRMHKKDQVIELMSWEHAGNQAMQEWVINNGAFVPLDQNYRSITYLKR